MSDYFSSYHPIVNIIYFIVVLLFAMFTMHPVLICISLICGTGYLLYLKRSKKVLKSIGFMSIMVIMVIIINPMFNHEGATILYYLKNGNPITKESVIYGVFMGLLLMSVVNWCGCYNVVVTSEKFVYLFGRIIPHFSLILSMTLRFIPRFKIQFKKVKEAREAVGGNVSKGSFINRMRNYAGIVSVMISWSLENSIETSDSMRSRGYGLKGRTAFSIYKFEKRDGIACGCIIGCMLIIGYGFICPELYYRYYPTFERGLFEGEMLILYVVYGTMCLIPMIINYMEEIKWKSLK